MTDLNAARAAAQQRVAPHARNLGAPWDGADIEFLEGFKSDPPEVLALALGRTVYGVYGALEALREGRLGGGHGRQGRPAAAAKPEPAWTFIGSDVPPGW